MSLLNLLSAHRGHRHIALNQDAGANAYECSLQNGAERAFEELTEDNFGRSWFETSLLGARRAFAKMRR